MPPSGEIIGRDRERAALEQALTEAAMGRAGLVLVAGEAGLGKTRLVEQVLADSGVVVLAGGARQEATAPYEPLVAALRCFLRVEPDGLRDAGSLAPHLALLLPELGAPPPGGDAATLFEAVRSALAAISTQRPVALFLDDLHWADDATLELLPALASGLEPARLLTLCAYRSDEIRRGHPLRRLRIDLRRAGRLRELVLEPLAHEETTVLAARVLGQPLSDAFAAVVYDRTQGVPFFVEELAAALGAAGRVREGPRGLELAGPADVPIPDTIRDAVVLRAAGLSDAGRAALEAATVAGMRFDFGLVAELAPEPGFDEAIEIGLVREVEPGVGEFRHALAREALYAEVPWARRRALHSGVAELLERTGAPPALVAEHWLAAREQARARPALLAAVAASLAVHAHRDALVAGRLALEAWPEGDDGGRRLALQVDVARSAELCGELPEAAAAWRELADRFRAGDEPEPLANAERRLATVYTLQGSVERALAARHRAADAFMRASAPGDAAAELLAAAAQLESAGRLAAAVELVEAADTAASAAGRVDLQARVAGLAGTIRAKSGDIEGGLDAIRAGLELALSADANAAAVDLYQRLANAYENAADYRAAEDAYRVAYDFCRANDASAAADFCLACLGFLLWQRGEWEQCLGVGREILASDDAPLGARVAAKQHQAFVAAARGEERRARKLLAEAGGYAERYQRERMEIWEVLAFAWVEELAGDVETAAECCRAILAAWGASEARHYPAPALRWATTFLACNEFEEEARACASALADLASATVNPDSLAGLAHGLGEAALIDGEHERAAVQFVRAAGLLRELELPYDLAFTQLRAGVAFAAAGQRELAVQHLTDGYRIARRLRARPLAARAAELLAALGEKVEERLGRRAAGDLARGGLTRREAEIVRLVAVGRTNREIAHQLFLSPRTVDMHVHNILVKLGCRSRAEASYRAAELGLVGTETPR